MEKERLPKQISPEKLAKLHRVVAGVVDIAQLTRLQGLLADNTGQISVQMGFDTDREGLTVIDMQIQGKLMLVCQSTLEAFAYPVDIQVLVSPIKDEKEVDRLPMHYEPFIYADDTFAPEVLVEEELLLALPLVPRKHEHGEQDLGRLIRSNKMAVQQNRKSRSKRDMRRAHDSLTAASLSEDQTTGETHRRHHVTANGYYRGKQVVQKKGD